MKKPLTVAALNDFGRIRLSKSFFMRDFLYSEIASIEKIPNIPDDPDLAIETGRHLCEELLEPLQDTFGRLAIRGSLRCAEVNGLGNLRQRQGKPGYACSTNEATAANHIWDRQDAYGFKGAMACVVVPWFADRYAQGADWRGLAWWIHDHLPYSELCFFPKLAAFNLSWHERPKRRIDSYIAPKGCLTKPGMDNHEGDHSAWYQGFPVLKR